MHPFLRSSSFAAALACLGCEDGGHWYDCTGRVNSPLTRTRSAGGRTECYCPEMAICHEDRFYPDAAAFDATFDAGRGDLDDASVDADLDAISIDADQDGGAPTLRGCPDAVGEVCWLLTPIETGLPASGAGADVSQIALRPSSGARGELLLFLNGSGGSPMGGAASLTTSWYTAARGQGLHALGISYRSDDAVGVLCRGEDACFLPTRLSIVEGRFQEGAATALAGITEDEGIYARVFAALRWLALTDPSGGWDAFFDADDGTPSTSIAWERVLASGHSQGGGHAALIGRRHALARVLMLASPCDTTAGSVPASWLAEPGRYATDTTTRFFGLGAMGDGVCPAHAAIWTALGMPSTAQDDTAMTCSGSSPHGDPIRCIENVPAWERMLAP